MTGDGSGKRVLSGVLAACALALVPASAQAVSVGVNVGELTIEDTVGTANDVTVEPLGPDVRVADTAGVTLATSTSGVSQLCVLESPQAARCPATTIQTVFAELRGADDRFAVAEGFAIPDAFVFGGPGDDDLEGGEGSDEFSGGLGDDVVRTDAGDDFASGSVGNDLVIGSAGDDQLIGNAGNDRCRGGAGDDECSMGQGQDRCAGDAGDDSCIGGGGRDRCDGGPGRDEAFSCAIERRIERQIDF